jgi:Dyp-type peroxidase family
MTNAAQPLPQRDVQGFGLAGFRKDHQRLLAVSLGSQQAGQKIVGRLAREVASFYEVHSFNQLFSEVRARRKGGKRDGEVVSSLWVAGMLSASGLRLLGVDPAAGAPTGEGGVAFLAGMTARAAVLGDDPSAAAWEAGIAGADALIVVAGDDERDVNDVSEDWSDFIDHAGGRVTWSEYGCTLPEPERGHEHFGFKDGVSQPSIDGIDQTPDPGEPAAAPLGEFLLGHPDQTGAAVPVAGPYVNASMVVFRRLLQDVAGFRSATAAGVSAAQPPLTQAQLQAKMIGRWPSGAPLEGNPESDPGEAANAFSYQTADPAGTVSPRWSHLRKVNPRDETTPDPAVDNPALHRMLRRGIPFGEPLDASVGAADDGEQRGLHFLAVVADLARQFEFVQANWLNSPNFPTGQITTAGSPYSPPVSTPADGADPVAGQCPMPNIVQLQQASGSPLSQSFAQRFVAMTGGEYFLLPAISTLKSLADGQSKTPPGPQA